MQAPGALFFNRTQIGNKGLQRLATALRENKVISSIFFLKAIIIIQQTVTALNLENNKIGDNGIKYLVEALKKNLVSSVLMSNIFFMCDFFYTDT